MRFNFAAEGATAAFTSALLSQDFGLVIDVPEGQLVPTVPQKLNYLHWIEDLLALPLETCTRDAASSSLSSAKSTPCATSSSPPSRPLPTVGTASCVCGIDIGTGCSCIYPLLATAMHPNWTMVATELSDVGVTHARKNVASNRVDDRIIIVPVSDPYSILCGTVFPTAPAEANSSDHETAGRPCISIAPQSLKDFGDESGTSGAVSSPFEGLPGDKYAPSDASVTSLSNMREHSACKHAGHEGNEVQDVESSVGVSADGVTESHRVEDRASATTTVVGGVDDVSRRYKPDVLPKSFDFCMCNPPFFDIGEKPADRSGHRVGKKVAGRAGTDTEMTTPGGEAGFVSRMIADSAVLGGAVRWCVSLHVTALGHAHSLLCV